MSGIAPILSRIAQIESRFSPTATTPARALGVSSTATANTTTGPATTVTGLGDTGSRFDMVMAAAESALGGSVRSADGGLPPGLEFISSTGATPTPWTAPAGAAPLHDHAHETTGPAGEAAVHPSSAGSDPHATPGSTDAFGQRSIGAGDDVVPVGTPFADAFERAGAAHGVPAKMLASVGWVESRYDVGALSPDGAIGVMQFMPGTAAELGVDPHDPVDAIDGAARLLRSHRDRFGTWELALAAYFSGPGAVARNGNQAPPRGADYAQRVVQRMETT